MAKMDSFFSARNTVREVSEKDQENLSNYLEAVQAFARTTYASIYVIDYEKQGFEYVSENPLFLCGRTPQEVLEMGYSFYFEHVPPEDLELLVKINKVGFDFYDSLPIEERKKYSLSYDFHLQTSDGNQFLINQTITPMFLNMKHKVWKALCIVNLSTNQEAGNITVVKTGESERHVYDMKHNIWRRANAITLTDREKDILLYSTRGYTVSEIANQIYVSPDTVKFHRKKLFDKLKVSSISEAISFATKYKLL